MTDTHHESWWDSLRHFGLLLSPVEVAKLADSFEPPALSRWGADQLRRELMRFNAGDLDRNDWVALVLERTCGFNHDAGGSWLRGRNVPPDRSHLLVTKETLKPTHLWTVDQSELPVFSVDVTRLGVGRGRKTVSDCVQWLRAAGQPLALATNGREWRLVFAGMDFDASCEWTTDLWFEEGGPGAQLHALRMLFQPGMFASSDQEEPPLLSGILASRRGQAELSSILGERVRESVELLVQSHRDPLTDAGLNDHGADIYRAAVRVVMRLVVVLFAESRELLPRSDPNYNDAYGLNSLFEQLQRLAVRGRTRLNHRFSAWPRLLGLFSLIYKGSHHPSLQVPAYGGELFAPGDVDSDHPLVRALHVFENACFDSRYQLMPDSVIHRMLELMTRTEIRIRQGRTTVRASMPVDFSDLSSEYIGILYEGLLDYELRTASPDDPIVFLAVGNEPALPLARLEAMDDRAIKTLFESLKDTGKDENPENEMPEDGPQEAGSVADVDDGETEVAGESRQPPDEPDQAESHDLEAIEAARTRAMKWTRRACLAAGLVRKPRISVSPEARAVFENKVDSKSRQLVRRVVGPGDWYLVRWGGTRKGSGSFYTRPALAVPTVQRTLRPLAYDPPVNEAGDPESSAPAERWSPKLPEEILALKVCDPACGSGSFPVAALRFLTDAVFASLYFHGRLEGDWRRPLSELLGLETGDNLESVLSERLPCPPDSDDFSDRTRSVLRRYVVDRCIYGVDSDPLATELCRLALWIETMDRDLPFSFLDHKIRCGNSLVGAWLDTFAHYPVMAWSREGGDKGHSNGVNYGKEAFTKAIKQYKADVVKPDLERSLMGPDLLQEDLHQSVQDTHEETLRILSSLHDLPVTDSEERGRRYREEFHGSETYQQLKAAMDLWCACWFWPAAELENSPLPTSLASPDRTTLDIASRVTRDNRFFHWELEFPDVFYAPESGFDALIGNPPWDIAKPNSKEYFSNIDPLYRTYGKQEALRFQTEYYGSKDVEEGWISYNANFRAQSNFFKYASRPFGDPALTDKSQDRFSVARGNRNEQLHGSWRSARAKSNGYSDPRHPYQHQGSGDVNLYKLFLEQGHALLRDDGALGFIVPSGLYSDYGTGALRELFIDHCRWEWLFGFENREKIFDIHRSFKFNSIIVRKGGQTLAINTAFMRRRLEDWQEAEKYVTQYQRERIAQFSPKSKAILEIRSHRDLDILEKIYANSVLLGDDGAEGWGVEYATEFHMTNDSKLFPPRPKWEERGYRPDEYSRWLKGNWRPIEELWTEMGVQPLAEGGRLCAQPPYDMLPVSRADIPPGIIISRDGSSWIADDDLEVALPVYNAKMINLFDFSSKAWVSGKGRSAVWKDLIWPKDCDPEYLMNEEVFKDNAKYLGDIRLLFKDISTAVHFRTMICSLVPPWPAVNAAPILATNNSDQLSVLQATLASYCLDYVARHRIGYLHLNYFVIEELPLFSRNRISANVAKAISKLTAELIQCHAIFAPNWLQSIDSVSWRSKWAITKASRMQRRCILDAVIAHLYGIDEDTYRDLFADCDLPMESLANNANLNPKGFWRVDRDKDPELRQSVLSFVAFCDLASVIEASGSREEGILRFLSEGSGEMWEIPETLRLADYGLGRDERSFQSQQVGAILGDRFYNWQVEQNPDESWRECHLHARNILGQSAYKALLDKIESGADDGPGTETETGQEPEIQTVQRTLF